MKRRDLRERFEEKFEEQVTGCWVWTASKSPFGYGYIGRGDGTVGVAHRVSWELYCSSIPEGLNVLHACDNPSCVNPEHLFLGTQGDNVRDMDAKGRRRKLPGEENPFAKLTAEKVGLIRQDPRMAKEMAAEFGVTKDHINKVKRRELWGHLA